MTTTLAIDWDVFFRVWAVIGPLLAATASALWARHVQVSDRQFDTARETIRLDRADASAIRAQLLAQRSEHYNEVKTGIATFMASSAEYVRKQSTAMTNPTSDNQVAASVANDKFTQSCQLVVLLGNEVLSAAAIAFSNAAVMMPKSYSTPMTDVNNSQLDEYRRARSQFNQLARAFVAELREPSV